MDGRSGQPQLREHDFQLTGFDIAVRIPDRFQDQSCALQCPSMSEFAIIARQVASNRHGRIVWQRPEALRRVAVVDAV